MPIATLEFSSRGRKLRMEIDLDPTRANENSIIKFLERGRHYEPDVSLAMCAMVDEGDVVVDVGANAGFFLPCCSAGLPAPRGVSSASSPAPTTSRG